MAEVKNNSKSGNKKGIIIAFIVILLAVNAVQLFLNFDKSNDIEMKEQTIDEQKAKIVETQNELNDKIAELDLKMKELAELGGDTARLGEQIRGLVTERDNLAKSNNYNYSRYISLKKEIDNANMIAKNAQEEVESLRSQLAQADSSIKQYRAEIVEKDDNISKLTMTKEDLAKKVAMASVLKVENINITAINSKGKVKEGDVFKAKVIDKIKVTFTIAENKIAKQEGKELILRVVEPDGAALFDAGTGGGSFMHEGKEIFYTQKQEILFDNRKPKVAFTYLKGSSYKPGKHTIEVYAEGYLIGEGSFQVK